MKKKPKLIKVDVRMAPEVARFIDVLASETGVTAGGVASVLLSLGWRRMSHEMPTLKPKRPRR